MSNWIPTKLEKQLQVFQAFSRGLAERPHVYGVSPADAAEAVRLVQQLEEAVIAATSPATRTALTIAAKQEHRLAAEKFIRRLGAFIRLNPNIAAADLMQIGLPPKTDPRRIPPPTTSPVLSIRRVIPGGHEIAIADSASPARPGKAKDTQGLELFVAYSPHRENAEPMQIETFLKFGKVHGILTRAYTPVIHPNERVGETANYIGRWLNGRGEAGPFSQPVRMLLAMPDESKLSQAA